jgi:phage terminase large subunit-like protein
MSPSKVMTANALDAMLGAFLLALLALGGPLAALAALAAGLLAVAVQDKITAKRLSSLPRKDLVQLLDRNRKARNEWIRRMVIKHHRVDILAEVVLGYKVEPHHFKILQHHYNNRHSLTLVWRGAGKTTVATIVWCIFLLILDRDRRILIASKTGTNAEDFLREIKGHFESNEMLREIFGDFVGTKRWDTTAIEVAGRTKPWKEPSINTVGVGGAVASKHYDVIIADDLVDEDNSRTKHQRDKMVDWYYKVLLPTLNPPDPKDRFIGCLHVIGTRYHYEDLYGHLSQDQPDGTGGEMKGGPTLIIPIVDEHGHPVWASKFPLEEINKLRQGMGLIRFNSQYMCDCELMKGSIFRYDDCHVLTEDEDRELMSSLAEMRLFHGVDLAISEDKGSDMFAQMIIAIGGPDNLVHVIDYEEVHRRFPEQTASIKKWARKYKPIRTGIEDNAYQDAQIQQLQHEDKKEGHEYKLNIMGVTTLKDKVTRAMVLSAKLFESKRIRFRPGQHKLIEHLVLFPGFRYKDLFDALDIAVTASEKRVKKVREKEPGLIGVRRV